MTDSEKPADAAPEPSTRKKVFNAITGADQLPPGKTKRAFYIITGIGDLFIIASSVKKSFSLLRERASFLNGQLKTLRDEGHQTLTDEPDYAAVMRNSPRTEEELLRRAGRIKTYWLACLTLSVMGCLFILAGALRLMLSAGGTGGVNLLLTTVMLLVVAALAASKVIHYDFMGWRIRNRCNSQAEQGTYHFYVLDGGRSQAFSTIAAGRLRGKHAES